MVRFVGGSWGLQIGFASTDLILFGTGSLPEKAFNFGVGGAIALGPFGRHATLTTNLSLGLIGAYSRSRGVFAGVSFKGADLRLDDDANARLYGNTPSEDVLRGTGQIAVPEAAGPLVERLNSTQNR